MSSISVMDGCVRSMYPLQNVTGKTMRFRGSVSRRHSTISWRRLTPLMMVA